MTSCLAEMLQRFTAAEPKLWLTVFWGGTTVTFVIESEGPNLYLAEKETRHGPHLTPAAQPVRRARALHRQADDGDPPRQTSPGLRNEPEQSAGAGAAVGRQTAARVAGEQSGNRARCHQDRSAKQRRRRAQPRPLLADDEVQGRRQSER